MKVANLQVRDDRPDEVHHQPCGSRHPSAGTTKPATWVNAYCAAQGFTKAIPDVGGQPAKVATAQFRRTLAWFIARRPGGSIAGAIAYRHHSVQMFEGYAEVSPGRDLLVGRGVAGRRGDLRDGVRRTAGVGVAAAYT